MAKAYRILVFGKAGCDKCKTLNKRLDDLLEREEWSDFEKQSCDVETVDGMVAFCKTECVNPQRIPAFVVMRRTAETDEFIPVERPVPGATDSVCGSSSLYQLIGLQTDYSSGGRGVLSPKMIQSALTEARGVVARDGSK
jgi:hypothetical protein